MADARGEAKQRPLSVAFDRRIKLEFHGARITIDGGLLAYREMDGALGPTAIRRVGADVISELREVASRGGRILLERLLVILHDLKHCSLPAACAAASLSSSSLRKSVESTRTGRKKLGLAATHAEPSAESPPPGTIMCTCGWCVIAEPQV